MSSIDKQMDCDPDLEQYCAMAVQRGVSHVKQIDPGSIVTEPWVRLKCRHGCPNYGKGHCCPPRTPDHKETRAILDCYKRAVLLHVELPHSALGDEKDLLRTTTDIVAIEGDFFKGGFYKTFLFLAGPCRLCKECQAVDDSPCIFPEQARPCMEGCGIDVFETVRKNGFSIETLGRKTDTSHIYCLLMVD